jgi:hypothetical protein
VLLGCDVTSCERPRGCSSLDEYFSSLASCFSAAEWVLIQTNCPDDPAPTISDAEDAYGTSSGSGSVSSSDARALRRFA